MNEKLKINNNYFTEEPEYNTSGHIPKNSPIHQFNKVVEDTIEDVKSKYTPDVLYLCSFYY
jgi:hypothetical protein